MLVPNNTCPECLKRYEKIPAICGCGWLFVKEETVSRFGCHGKKNGKPCDGVGTNALSSHATDWYCEMHIDEARQNSYVYK